MSRQRQLYYRNELDYTPDGLTQRDIEELQREFQLEDQKPEGLVLRQTSYKDFIMDIYQLV